MEADLILRRLLKAHFWFNNDKQGHEWSYKEDTTIKCVDPKLQKAINDFLNKGKIQ